MADGRDTTRTSVKTYVPEYQKEIWSDHASELDMSQSEFVRTMVQAGRKAFEVEPSEGSSSPSDPQGDDVEERVLRILDGAQPLSWGELLDEISGDLEERLEDALSRLQDRNEVRYSGRKEGYTLVDDEA